MPRAPSHLQSALPPASRRAFTLIEMMVVIGIIIILAGLALAVGMQVKRHAQERSTRTTLKALDNIMSDYLGNGPDGGNQEPLAVPTGTSDQPPPPCATVWVTAFSLNPSFAKSLTTQHLDLTNGVILDAYGNAIWYIPRDYDPASQSIKPGAKTPGRFVSLGPDGQYGTSDDLVSDGVP